MLEIRGWKNLDDAFAKLEKEVEAIARGVTYSAWKQIMFQTPQYSGDTAASWTYSLGSPKFVHRQVPRSEPREGDEYKDNYRSVYEPKSKGHGQAIAIATVASFKDMQAFSLGQKVYISNLSRTVDGRGEGVAQAIEDGSIYLRGINRPGRPLGRMLDAVKTKYSLNISRRAAAQLKNSQVRYRAE